MPIHEKVIAPAANSQLAREHLGRARAALESVETQIANAELVLLELRRRRINLLDDCACLKFQISRLERAS